MPFASEAVTTRAATDAAAGDDDDDEAATGIIVVASREPRFLPGDACEQGRATRLDGACLAQTLGAVHLAPIDAVHRGVIILQETIKYHTVEDS